MTTYSAPIISTTTSQYPRSDLLCSHVNIEHSTDGQFSRNFVEKLLSQLEDKPVPHMTPNELAHLTSLIETTLEVTAYAYVSTYGADSFTW